MRLATPADVQRLGDAVASAVADVVARFDDPAGRPHRLVAAAYPRPATASTRRTWRIRHPTIPEEDIAMSPDPVITVTLPAPVPQVWQHLRDPGHLRRWRTGPSSRTTDTACASAATCSSWRTTGRPHGSS